MSIPNIDLRELVNAGVPLDISHKDGTPKCKNIFTVQEKMFTLSI